jgi:ribonuclease R
MGLAFYFAPRAQIAYDVVMPKKPRPPKPRSAPPADKRERKGRPPQHREHGAPPAGSHGSKLPDISVLNIHTMSEEGELLAIPANWDPRRKPPHIVVTESGRAQACTVGDRILAKLRRITPNLYQAMIIRVLEADKVETVVGVFVPTGRDGESGIIEPVSRRKKESFMVASGDTMGAQRGELVCGITQPGVPTMGMSFAKITERLGRMDSPKAASLIAASIHQLPSVFSQEALDEAQRAPVPTLTAGRTDLRHIPLVTIDGADARDFDDAVFAEPDGDGFHLLVAIAEVAFYVEENSALDKCAYERGNSVYFPDRVIPMLPERLSNGLCSLMPNEDRFCLAVHIWIDGGGTVKKYEFVRGIMRSRARLTYEQVEQCLRPTEDTSSELPADVQALIANLGKAYSALAHERDKRGALNLNLPEFKIQFDASGNVENIYPRMQLDSHRLIECFMIAANVAAADYLITHRGGGIFRVHEAPSEEKLDDVRTMLKAAGYSLQKGVVTAAHFNRVLRSSENAPDKVMVHTAVLRAQMQAYYSHENVGHFGLGLQKYCHFTSPIRRYSDLLVHRALIALIEGHGKAKRTQHPRGLSTAALHISDTERKAMMAERDAADRYKVSYMARKLGNVFGGVISGLNEYGLFVTLPDTGVTGFVPVRNMGHDFFNYDKRNNRFTGQRSKVEFTLGMPLTIKVVEANTMTGSLIFTPEIPEQSEHEKTHGELRPLRPHHPRPGKKHPPRGQSPNRERPKTGKKPGKFKGKKR